MTSSIEINRQPIYQRRWWRLLYRLPWLLVHLVLALPLTVICQSQGVKQRMIGELTFEDRAARWWCAGLARIFGIHLKTIGHLNHDPVLIVANHISWMDIVALLSLRMIRFVAKDEIRRWPVVGWLVTRAGTVYVQRGNSDSATQVHGAMTQTLESGEAVAIFPEGGIHDIPGVARFRSRLFSAAIEAGVDVEPVCLRYKVAGQMTKAVGFLPDEHFLGNFFRLLSGPPTTVEIDLLPRLPTLNQERRELAEKAQHMVTKAYQQDTYD